MIPAFEPTGHLPVGRHSCDPYEAEQFLVEQDRFAISKSRRMLWDQMMRYVGAFFTLEERYKDDLPGPIVDRMWLGGSFASAKVDPRNVDLTLIVNRDAKEAVKGRPGAGIFTLNRTKAVAQYNVSPLLLHYQPVVHVFQMDRLEDQERTYLTQRGIWDDWWQRTRLEGKDRAPSIESCVPRRGYLEVVLRD